MEIIVSCVCSVFISICIGNVVGIYYLEKNDKEWKKVFDDVTKITIEEINKLKK